jgi:hypothetical protein
MEMWKKSERFFQVIRKKTRREKGWVLRVKITYLKRERGRNGQMWRN